MKRLIDVGVDRGFLENKPYKEILKIYVFHYSKNFLMIPLVDSFLDNEHK